MAPRKKKLTKGASRKKLAATIQKEVEIVDESVIENPEPETQPEPEIQPELETQPELEAETDGEHTASARQHKKFGKFRCLLEEVKPESDDSDFQQETLKTDCEEIDKENLDENMESVALLDTEDHVEYKEIPNETELSEQLTQLNVLEDYSVIADVDGEIYISNVESDITVECVSEEVIAEPDEAVFEETEELEDKNEDVEEDEEPIPESEEIVEIQKKPKKKQTKSRKSLPKSVTSKAKAIKNQLVIEAQNSNSDASSTSESSIRRSSRIKSINVLKQKTKTPNTVKKVLDSDTSENSNSSHIDSEKTTPAIDSQIAGLVIADDTTKPVKVKSRWRRSSELEMSNASSVNSNSTMSDAAAKEKIRKEAEEEVTMRLKQFIHLKENQYLTDRVSCKEAKKMTCDCFLTLEEIEKGENGCGDDCLNRLLMIECGNLCPLGDRCTNKRFQKSQFAPVEVFRTEKKGLGIRASADIPYGEFILEYVGEVLNPDEFEKRANVYSEDKNQHYYFMSLRSDAVIDATQKGNISRFINHSCDPNAETQKWTVNGELRIGFFSKRTILAGEEITFDYQFQRYGKEAQKCYCETALCRGWLGEEPDEDEEEEEIEEEVELEEEEEEEEEDDQEEIHEKEHRKQEKIEKQDKKEDEVALKTQKDDTLTEVEEKPIEPPSIDLAIPKQKSKALKAKKEKKTIIRRKKKTLRKELFEDPDLDEEIASLMSTGLKNQAHTLKLSRLMVRAKEPQQRSKLLKLLRHGEFPCRRLFLDYHGLRLMHGWMTETQQLANEDKKYESLRLELLQTLATLPIPNKTMLQDSKVLATVEKWAVNEKDTADSPADSESNSPKDECEQVKEEQQVRQQEKEKMEEVDTLHEKKIEEVEEEVEEEQIFLLDDIFEFNEDLKEIRKSVGMEGENLRPFTLKFPNNTGKKLIDELMVIFDDGVEYEIITTPLRKSSKKPVNMPPPFDYEVEIVALAVKLLEEWSSLKEVFRIPKKERIEQMKEHEREADRKYKALLGLEQENEKKAADRYRYIQRHRVVDVVDRSRRLVKPDDRSSTNRFQFDKLERRKMFAEEERRRQQRDQWRMVEKQVNQRYATEARGFQYVWNPQTGQWQAISLAQPALPPALPPPTSHYPYPSTVLGQPLVSVNQPPPSHYPYIPQHTGLPVLPQQSQPPPTVIPQLPGQIPQINPQKIALPHTGIIPLNNQPPLPSLPYQDVIKEQEELSQVKFLGPIPPPAKLPPKWKCAKDKYGRPYYYHIKIRISQWEPPDFPKSAPVQEVQEEDTSSSSTSSLSSDSSSEDSDSDDDIDDTDLLIQIRKKLAATASICEKKPPEPDKIMETKIKEELEKLDETRDEFKIESTPSPEVIERTVEKRSTSIDERLKEQFNLLKDEEVVPKKRRAGLVEEIIISPRTEADKLQFKEDLKRFKENKEKLKRQKALIMEEAKKQMKMKAKVAKSVKKHKTNKAKVKEVKDTNSEAVRKIKETFRSNMAGIMVNILNAYRKPDCKLGRIQNTEDFKHLARKLTHFVMLKEIKQCDTIEDLTVTDSVKIKAKEFVRKYMSKFGSVYQRPKDDVDF